ncbi:PepSY domain-containing protein [Actinopolyspora mortivallis]|uniref:PepSY domain-containing protein n=1 Tax=Actinopolyspora mortivallis TaxID=33906 RepID=UPI0003A7E16F|nr:PepSY domain-containing protein [Actinopolyspora mortivallis]
MPATRKLVAALAVTGGVLALGGTAVAFGGGDGQQQAPAGDGSPVVREASGQPYTGPDRDEIHTGPEEFYHGPRPGDCTKDAPEVSAEQARKTALERVPGTARVTEVELDRCYEFEWDVELREADTEYEVTVDARSGDVLGYETDRDD